jgi:tripartite-type tricarboxylate transporter receptor subunit TctC
MSLPDVKEQLAVAGYTTINGTPEAFAAHLETELASWSAIAQEQNIKLGNDGLPAGVPISVRQ